MTNTKQSPAERKEALRQFHDFLYWSFPDMFDPSEESSWMAARDIAQLCERSKQPPLINEKLSGRA